LKPSSPKVRGEREREREMCVCRHGKKGKMMMVGEERRGERRGEERKLR
jgi:hypothetical protein